MVKSLLERNEAWARRINAEEPDFFRRLSSQQAPEFFWIGCSDSRVPANVVAGLDPGEVFVHRNVANVVHSSDMNLLSALEFAVETLKVRYVIVTGHYGCGGVHAACGHMTKGLASPWLEPIRRLLKGHAGELSTVPEGEERVDMLCELNVRDGVRRVAETPIMRRAWEAGANITVHGLIYGLKDGRLRDLDCSISSLAELEAFSRPVTP